MKEIVFLVPGRLDQLTGGYLYDRQIVDRLRSNGRPVRVIELISEADHEALATISDGSTAVVDGLALPLLEKTLGRHAVRLRLVGFVHHTLALETGLSRVEAEGAAALEAALLPRFRGILCPSQDTAAAVAGYGVGADRLAVVPPGTAKPLMAIRRIRRRPPRSLLCVASLVPRKGHAVLIDALARLRDLDWKLMCVGALDRDQTVTRLVRRQIAAAGLQRRITLAGEWPPAKLPRAYRAADLFVLASFHEGYGMVFAEAMAHGLPIIATRAGAIPETVPKEAGVLVPPGDPQALARALRRVLTEPALVARLATGSRSVGARLPTWPSATTQWEKALDRLALRDPPPLAASVSSGGRRNSVAFPTRGTGIGQTGAADNQLL
jgi:glycosyltransferase involved in cell wall biosynthesis